MAAVRSDPQVRRVRGRPPTGGGQGPRPYDVAAVVGALYFVGAALAAALSRVPALHARGSRPVVGIGLARVLGVAVVRLCRIAAALAVVIALPGASRAAVRAAEPPAPASPRAVSTPPAAATPAPTATPTPRERVRAAGGGDGPRSAVADARAAPRARPRRGGLPTAAAAAGRAAGPRRPCGAVGRGAAARRRAGAREVGRRPERRRAAGC